MFTKIKRKIRKIAKFHLNNTMPVLIFLIVVLQLVFPQVALAASQLAVIDSTTNEKIVGVVTDPDWNYSIRLPEINNKEPRFTIKITVTAYNSLPWQTDDTPCITASGMDICERNTEDIIATNLWYLPFGTKVRLPDLYGDKIFQIEDRMNKRYSRRVDIWMKEYTDAKSFGRRWTRMEIF